MDLRHIVHNRFCNINDTRRVVGILGEATTPSVLRADQKSFIGIMIYEGECAKHLQSGTDPEGVASIIVLVWTPMKPLTLSRHQPPDQVFPFVSYNGSIQYSLQVQH